MRPLSTITKQFEKKVLTFKDPNFRSQTLPHEGNLRRPRYAKGELKRIRVKSAEELRRDWEREKRRGAREREGRVRMRGGGISQGSTPLREKIYQDNKCHGAWD